MHKIIKFLNVLWYGTKTILHLTDNKEKKVNK